MDTKHCPGCCEEGQTIPLSRFKSRLRKYQGGTKLAYRSRCDACEKKDHQAYKDRQSGKVDEAMKAYTSIAWIGSLKVK